MYSFNIDTIKKYISSIAGR